jgi:ribonuclease BN (tRNA processing enzyme)
LILLSAGARLFIYEASFYDKRPPSHLDYRTLMQNCSRLGCKRLILTHMSPDMLARSSEVPIETAHDGMEVLL